MRLYKGFGFIVFSIFLYILFKRGQTLNLTLLRITFVLSCAEMLSSLLFSNYPAFMRPCKMCLYYHIHYYIIIILYINIY